jgi:CheY-like chemotaxis protein
VKFTERGHVAIAVSGRRRGEWAEVEITVADTGCGIPPDKLGVIFDKFEQVDNSPARRFDGAGLGLAISRRIVEAMDGEIFVESAVGVGSAFKAAIPLKIDAREQAKAVDAFADVRALVVDDNAVNRAILVEQLSSWGIEATAVCGAGEALDAARRAVASRNFQIAIVDHHMPDMNGVDLARAMRAEPVLALIPLVLLTSAGRKGHPEPALRELFDAYLVKPARASMLLDAIGSALNRRSSDLVTIASAELAAGEGRACPFTPDGSPLDVLVAEDNVVNQMVIKAMLEKLGCAVRMADDGREAIEEYRRAAPDLVLMDISMPEVDGVEATALIRDLQARSGRRAPIIGVTAHALREDRQRCLDAGMDDYLPKPVRQRALEDVLRKATAGSARSAIAS